MTTPHVAVIVDFSPDPKPRCQHCADPCGRVYYSVGNYETQAFCTLLHAAMAAPELRDEGVAVSTKKRRAG